VIDCETKRIASRPAFPPEPVGVSIKWPGKRSHYLAWGHATSNNCTKAQARRELREAYRHGDGVLFQNARFDTDVIETHLGLKPPVWHQVQDDLFLLFLKDPDVGTLELKPAAERLLGWAPEERDELELWFRNNPYAVPGVKVSYSRGSEHFYMNHLDSAPGNVVGRYSNGDTARCDALFKLLYEEVVRRGMGKAYDRERKLTPYMLAAERRGLRVDLSRLEKDLERYEATMVDVDLWLRKKLRIGESINLDSDKEMLPVLLSSGFVEESKLLLTKKKQEYSTAKGSLQGAMRDGGLAALFSYRAQLATCLRTYLRNWRDMATESGGFIYTFWNQTRNAEGKAVKGTRTGRMSCTWFMNMPKEFKPLFRHDTKDGIDPSDLNKRRKLPVCPLERLPVLPLCRGYVLPYRKGDVIVDRDYNQQEPRILAHFEDGELMRQYEADPWLDVHDNAKAHIERIYRQVFDRRKIKIINLGLIYGEGVVSMAAKMGETIENCSSLKKAVLKLYPGLGDMNRVMKELSAKNQPLRTWGGREYFCEPPILHHGEVIHFEYKMVNRLVQGSAADCTKEAIIRWHENKHPDDEFMLQVHDQMACSTPRRGVKRGMTTVREAMESVEFDVKMLTEGDVGLNWGELVKYDRRGEFVWQGMFQ
jgi:DNA polymerase I-like protein with 3'-5' exonuclease and polymerase domains